VFFSPVSKFLIVIRTVAPTILYAVFKEFIFMNRILIAILAVFVGLVVGVALNFGIGKLNVQFFPMPDGVTWADKEGVRDWLENLPQKAFILVLIAHLSQAFVGGFVAALIAKRNMMCVAIAVGILSMCGGIMNMMMIPTPKWMYIELPLYLVVAWIAAKIVMKMRGKSIC
jgi:hypothetical protein